MRRKTGYQFGGWRWLLVVILLCVMIPSCQFAPPELTPSSPSLARSPTASSPSSHPQEFAARLAPPQNLPSVDPAQLLQHVQALAFERYADQDRDRVRKYLTETLTQLGWTVKRQPFGTGENSGVNLIATRPGQDPNTGTLLVSAHYDTVTGSPGADDNASSLATVLEVARLVGGRSTPRTLQLAFFDQEETGLWGSLAFTRDARNLTNLVGVINLEMLGYACYIPGCQTYPDGLPIQPPSTQGDFLGVVGDEEHRPLLKAFEIATEPKFPTVFTLAVPLKGLLMPDLLRSDHAPFWARNIGAVIVGDTANFRNPHYHQPSDTPDTLDRRFLTGTAQRVLTATLTLLESRGSLETPTQ